MEQWHKNAVIAKSNRQNGQSALGSHNPTAGMAQKCCDRKLNRQNDQSALGSQNIIAGMANQHRGPQKTTAGMAHKR
jgi:hypothetical protein